MPFFYFDSTFILIIPAFLFAIIAQQMVKSTFAKYSRVKASTGLRGAEVAQRLMHDANITDVKIEKISGTLSDHYDPRSRTLRLSGNIYDGSSVAALGIAAHEAGHAIQHARSYQPFYIRQTIVPVASLSSNLAFPMFFIGMIFSSFQVLMDIGILLFVGAVFFHLVTLPVEFNASSRALALLSSRGYLYQEEMKGARKVLNAAAMTYVAATAVAIMHLIRMVLLRGARD